MSTNTEPKLPASLPLYVPGNAILRHIRRGLASLKWDQTTHGLTEERRLELRFGLIVCLMHARYCIKGIGLPRQGFPRLSPGECAELDRLNRAITFGPHGDTRLSYHPREGNDTESIYWSLLQESTRAERGRARESERRRNGAAAIARNAREKAALFWREFPVVQNEKPLPVYSVKTQVEETARRLRKRGITRLSDGTAWGYYCAGKKNSKG